jgi:hypothetical protein
MDHVDDPVALLTITPPGNDHLAADHFGAWNKSAAKRWAKFDRWAKGKLRREGLRVRPVLRIAQRQRRGLDHLHLVLRAGTPADRAGIDRYVALLKQRHLEYGFGFIDDPYHRRRSPTTGKLQTMVFEDPRIAARYLVGRYLIESPQLAALLDGDHSFRALWVAPELTQRSGCTVRRLRRVRHAYFVTAALAQGSRPTMPVWWGNLGERRWVLSLLRPVALAAT